MPTEKFELAVLFVNVLLFELVVRLMPSLEFNLAVLFVNVLFELEDRTMPYAKFELAVLFVTVLLFELVPRTMPIDVFKPAELLLMVLESELTLREMPLLPQDAALSLSMVELSTLWK